MAFRDLFRGITDRAIAKRQREEIERKVKANYAKQDAARARLDEEAAKKAAKRKAAAMKRWAAEKRKRND